MIKEITSLCDPGVEVFGQLTEAQLRNTLDPEKGLFIAESPKVIRVALDAGYEPVSLLCERRHITGDAADIIDRCPDIPVYTGDRDLLAQLTGYTLTRGVLCAMRRPKERPLAYVLEETRRVVVIDGVVDTTNIGAIFRSAAALGIDAVLLTRQSCDPLNRRAVRVSMGSHRQVHTARRPHPDYRAAPRHHHGHRGRRSSYVHHRLCRLCRPHPHGPWRRFTQCRCRCRRRLLATAVLTVPAAFPAVIVHFPQVLLQFSCTSRMQFSCTSRSFSCSSRALPAGSPSVLVHFPHAVLVHFPQVLLQFSCTSRRFSCGQ